MPTGRPRLDRPRRPGDSVDDVLLAARGAASGARLEGTTLSGLALRGADLRGAVFVDAVLRGVDLRGADLRDADLRAVAADGVDLRDADLRGARCAGSTWAACRWEGAVLDAEPLAGAVVFPDHVPGTRGTVALVPDAGVSVHRVAWSPDGTWLALGTTAGVSIRSRFGRTQVSVLGAGDVHDVAWSPDGHHVAFGTDAGVEIGDPWTAERLAHLAGSGWSPVRALAWSRDGRLAIGSDGGVTEVWDPGARRLLARFDPRNDRRVAGVAWHPSGETIATVDGGLWSWDAATGEGGPPLAPAAGHGVLAFHPRGEHLVTGDEDGTVTIRDPATGRVRVQWEAHTGRVLSVGWSPDGERVLTTGVDDALRTWTPAGVRLRSATLPDLPHGAAFSPDGAWIAVAHHDLSLRDGETLEPCGGLRARPVQYSSRLSASPDGRFVALGSQTATEVWDTHGGRRFPIDGGAPAWGGGRLAVAAGTEARLVDPDTGAVRATLKGHRDRVTALAFSLGGRYLATASADRTAAVWNVETGAALRVLAGHRGGVTCVAFSPDSRRLATGSSDGAVGVWDVASKARLRTWSLPGDAAIDGIAWSADGRRLAALHGTEATAVWDVDADRLEARVTPPDVRGRDLAWHPDGTRLAVAADEGGVWSWSAEGGPISWPQAADVRSVAYSADGTGLCAGVDDGSAVVWRGTERVAVLSGHRAAPAVAWAGGGLVTGDAGVLRLWSTADGSLRAISEASHDGACTRVPGGPARLDTAAGAPFQLAFEGRRFAPLAGLERVLDRPDGVARALAAVTGPAPPTDADLPCPTQRAPGPSRPLRALDGPAPRPAPPGDALPLLAGQAPAAARWVSAVPPSLREWWDGLAFGTRDWRTGERLLRTAVPTLDAHVLALLGWYGSGEGWWSAYPSYEEIPEKLLDLTDPNGVRAVIDRAALGAAEREGAARYLCRHPFCHVWGLSERTRAALRAHALASTDPDRVNRALRAFARSGP